MASSGNSLSIHSRVDVGRVPTLVAHWARKIHTGVDRGGLYENHLTASTGKTMKTKTRLVQSRVTGRLAGAMRTVLPLKHRGKPLSFMVLENGLQGCWGEGAMQSMLPGALSGRISKRF